MKYNYIFVNRDDKTFKSICNYLSKHVAKENYKENGGTLPKDDEISCADFIVICTKGLIPVGYNSILNLKDGLYINQIGVKNKYKQQGIGTEMMKTVMSLAEGAQRDIYTKVEEKEKIAQKFFESVGFNIDEELTDEYDVYYEFKHKKPKSKLK